MEHHSTSDSGLPANAYKELQPGETYRPIIDPTQPLEEITWSVIWGLIMAVIFSAAAAYSGLKIAKYLKPQFR